MTIAPANLLVEFEETPDATLESILFRQGAHNCVLDLACLLAQPGHKDFVQLVDATAYRWLRGNWGRKPDGDSGRLAAAWERFFYLVYLGSSLSLTGSVLVSYFEESFFFLKYLDGSSNADPLGCYLLALSAHQCDNRLQGEWLELCGLPARVEPDHALYIFSGIRYMPPSFGSRSSQLCCAAVIALNLALERLVRRSELDSEAAREISSELVVWFCDEESGLRSDGGGF